MIALTLAPRLEEIARARAALAELGRAHGAAPRSLNRMQVVLDELLSNVVHHAGTPCDLGLDVEGHRLILRLSDSGPAFDPTRPPQEDRPRLGGRGLDLVRGLADELTYRRVDGRNLLIFTKAFETMENEMIQGLAISEERDGARATVRLDGRIDSGNAGQLTRHALELVEQACTTIVIDMGRLDYLTSAGFRTLLIVSDAVEAKGGALKLRAMSEDVRDLFEMSGLIGAFEVEDAAGAA